MPQYLAPGVYVEETTFRTGSIEGVSTSTAAFVGPTRYGPISGTPTLLTCLQDFIAIYGGIDPLLFDGVSMTNYVAQAVRAFFDNGGASLYVSRTWNGDPSLTPSGSPPVPAGYAFVTLPPTDSLPTPQVVTWEARYPGAAGNMTLVVTLNIGQDVLGGTISNPTVAGLNDYDIVCISPVGAPGTGALYCAESYLNTTSGALSWKFDDASGNVIQLVNLNPQTQEMRVLTASLQINYPDLLTRSDYYPGLTCDPRSSGSFAQTFAQTLSDSYYALTRPIVFTYEDYSSQPKADAAGIYIAQLLLGQVAPGPNGAIGIPQMIGGQVAQYTTMLQYGNDGSRPIPDQYEGDLKPPLKMGLYALEDVNDVSIVAAPGSTYLGNQPTQQDFDNAQQNTNLLIAHAEKMLYRIAVLDSPDQQAVSDISSWRGQFDSSYAALYYPWVRILDPYTNQEANMPPSGYVCGIYARNDTNEGVQKAPANEVVTDAIGFESTINKAQQDLLNPQDINCFRYFPSRGYLLWGARCITTDVLNQYVNTRRYMNYLKKSIDEGTQSVVFENNGPALWASVTQLVTDFLHSEFRAGRLFGTTDADAYFVRCDLTTMTQNDLDNGRLVCLIGVALLKPAEFVIFRIGQWTAGSTPQ